MNGCCRMHWCCCIMPLVSGIFWGLAVVALVFAWLAWRDVFPWGERWANYAWGAQWWYWNALVLGVLAVYGRGKRFGACKGGHCGSCNGMCKDGSCRMK